MHLRVARPATDPERCAAMYCKGLGFVVRSRFVDHDGFDGVMVGDLAAGYHFEFVRSRMHPVAPTPTVEDLLVFYVPDAQEWQRRCDAMSAAGFATVDSFSPYWAARGRTFVDVDGYRTVIQRASWPA